MDSIISRLTNPDLIFLLPALLIGITIHEFSHAWTSSTLGDPTPRYQGRVTLNPIAHLDPIGLVALVLFGFGWGKPVQIDDRHYAKRKQGRILVSLAGPLSNLVLAFIIALIMRLLYQTGVMSNFVWKMLMYILQINLVLCVFNLLPIPPLDGSKLLLEIIPLPSKYEYYYRFQRYSMLVFFALLYMGVISAILTPVVNKLLSLMVMIIY